MRGADSKRRTGSMSGTTRGSLTLGAFLFFVGLLFTVLAPGGLGEVTMVAGVAMVLAAFAPVGVLRAFGRTRALYGAMVLLVIGTVFIVADWSDAVPHWIEMAGGFFFLAGVLTITLYATAPRDRAEHHRQ